MRPYLRVANVFEDRIDTSDVMEMHFSDEEFERFRLRPGDVLLNEGQSPHLLGRPAIYRGDPPGVAFTNSLIRFRVGPAILPEWALIVFRHHMHSKRFMRESRITTNIAHLSATRFGAIEFPVPPLEEQKSIVVATEEQFSRIDGGSAALEQAKARSRHLRASILQQAITSAADYPHYPVKELLREPLRNGHSSKATPAGTIPVFTLTAVTKGQFTSDNTKLTAADPARIRNLWVKPGDVLIERSNTRELVGTTRLYDGPADLAVYPDLVIRARFSDMILPEYAEIVLQAPSSRDYFRQRAQGISGTMPKIDQATIEALEIPLPPIGIQEHIVNQTRVALDSTARLQGDLAVNDNRASRLRSSILAAAFSGKLVPQHALTSGKLK